MSHFNHIAAEMQAWLEGGELARKAYCAAVIAEAEERSRLHAHVEPPCPTQPRAWTLRKPERFHGYTEPLFEALRAAHVAGEPRPTAREILRLWAAKLPWEVMEATPEGVKYQADNGGVKFADIPAIGKSIKRMVV